jgi:hypothetical protein
VADLQRSLEQAPETLLACLREMARMPRPEKRALKSYLRTNLPVNVPETLLQALREAIGTCVGYFSSSGRKKQVLSTIEQGICGR